MQTLDIQSLQGLRDRLLQHPIYQELDSPEKVRIFMKHHVFAVWDFMSLLKRLQQLLTVTDVPWMPDKPPMHARFINEIVLGEETDEDGRGGYISHYDLYLEAMQECGADAEPIQGFLQRLREGESMTDATTSFDIPPTVRDFVCTTMKIALKGQPHEVAAAFFFGREDIIPDMFTHLVAEIKERGGTADRLVYYLNRHIELDGDTHGPLAEKLVTYLCGDDPAKIEEAMHVAERCLEKRIYLWDGVLEEVRSMR